MSSWKHNRHHFTKLLYHHEPFINLFGNKHKHHKYTDLVNKVQQMNLYLKVAIDKVKEEDASDTDEELCRWVKVAQVDAQDSEFLYWFDMRRHQLRGWRHSDGDVLPWAVIHHPIFTTHDVCRLLTNENHPSGVHKYITKTQHLFNTFKQNAIRSIHFCRFFDGPVMTVIL